MLIARKCTHQENQWILKLEMPPNLQRHPAACLA